jgi:hypothetical protein
MVRSFTQRDGWCSARRAMLGGLVLALAASPSRAQSGRFGGMTVSGIRVSAGDNTPRTVFQDPSAFTSARLCAAVETARPAIASRVNSVVGGIDRQIARRVRGVRLVRYGLTVSPDCTATATAISVNSRTALTVHATLPGNSFVTNVTTPDLSTFAGPIGLPQGADPRLTTTFDIGVDFDIHLPETPTDTFRADGPMRIAIRNVSQPQGVNFTGHLVGWLADVGSSIYDVFSGGEAGRLLAQGLDTQAPLPASLFSTANAALLPLRGYTVIAQGLEPSTVTLRASNGGPLVDARCIPGYVWRTVRPDDLVCVTPEVRRQVREDNARASERRVAEPSQGTLALCGAGRVVGRGGGPSAANSDCVRAAFRIACRPGFVWRGAVADDYVCVPVAQRDQARADNAEARRRRVDYTPVIH